MAILDTQSRILGEIDNPENVIASLSGKTIVEDTDGTTEMAIDVGVSWYSFHRGGGPPPRNRRHAQRTCT